MPLYEYRCQKKRCQHVFVEFFSNREDPKAATAKCPRCKKGIGIRLLSAGKFRIDSGFNAGMFEDFADKPIPFKSKAEMEKYCRDNNMELRKMPDKLK